MCPPVSFINVTDSRVTQKEGYCPLGLTVEIVLIESVEVRSPSHCAWHHSVFASTTHPHCRFPSFHSSHFSPAPLPVSPQKRAGLPWILTKHGTTGYNNTRHSPPVKAEQSNPAGRKEHQEQAKGSETPLLPLSGVPQNTKPSTFFG